MTAAEAAKLLDLGVDATAEQLESRFLELRRRLEEKIAKAPTPGLQAKYRASLAEITVAFETLTLAADVSLLPMLNRGVAVGGSAPTVAAAAGPSAAAAAPVPPSRPSPQKKASHGKEFALVALFAVLVLAAGGWWVIKVRADKAERQRIEHEQRIAAELAAKEAAAAAAAEADRIAKLATQLRTAMAEQRVNWEAIELKARDAERRASELKSELRAFREGPATKKAELAAMAHRHGEYVAWLTGFLPRHPAKLARARAEEFLNAKAIEEAVPAVRDMQAETAEAETTISEEAARHLQTVGSASFTSTPTGLKFIFTDAYGRTYEGTTPAELERLPLSVEDDAGPVAFTYEPTARFLRPGWPDIVVKGTTYYVMAFPFEAEFPEAKLQVNSKPAGLPFEVSNALGWKATGKTPEVVTVPPGAVTVKTVRSNYRDVSAEVTLEAGKQGEVSLDHRAQSVRIKIAEANAKIYLDGKLVGQGSAEVADVAPGSHTLRMELAGYNSFQTTINTVQEFTAKPVNLSFADLAVQNITCTSCKGAGSFARSQRCDSCGGDGLMRCYACNGGGKTYTTNYNPSTNRIDKIELNCFGCGGRGYQNCNNGDCERGKVRWTESCSACAGDGRRSRLELQ